MTAMTQMLLTQQIQQVLLQVYGLSLHTPLEV